MNRLLIGLVLTFCASVAQADEQCALHQLGSLEMTQLADKAVVVNITIAGKPQVIGVNISAPFSYLYADYADAQGFQSSNLPRGVIVHVNNTPSTKQVTVPDFIIGNVEGKDVKFVRVEGPHRAGEVGEIALDVLSQFDVELNLKDSKLNLFSPDHCKGTGVYWAKTYATLPFETDKSGHTNFKMDLDGKPVSVSFDLAPSGRMGMATAKRIFDVDENSMGLTAITGRPPGALALYRYPFKSLSVQGVSISNPRLVLYAQDRECMTKITMSDENKYVRCYGGSDAILGLNELLQLHLYFAFKEKMLYVTSADAHL